MPAALGKRVGGILKKKRAKCHNFDVPDLGTIVGRALVLNRIIELKRGDDWEDWQDPRKVYGSLTSGSRSGLAGQLISNAEIGGRLARDLHHVITNREPRVNPSTEVGAFKIAPGSKNTIRVSAGPDRRVRRQKYEWERAETKRKIHKAIATGLIVGGGTLGIALHSKGGGQGFKSIVKGAGMYAKEGAEKTQSAGRYVVDKIMGRTPIRPVKASSPLQKKADSMATHTPTPEADRVVVDPGEDYFKKTRHEPKKP